MSAPSAVRYRKTKQGEWVAFGPANRIRSGRIDVRKKDGSVKTEVVERLGRPFSVDGVECRYGYLAPSSRCDQCRCHTEPDAGAPGSIAFDGCPSCGCSSDC